MKKVTPLTVACLLAFASCSNELVTENQTADPNQLHPVQFSLLLEKEVLPFPATRSIPDYDFAEPSVPNVNPDPSELTQLCTEIEYLVYRADETEKLVKHKRFSWDATNQELDFGIVYDSLPAGNYHIYFLAHNTQDRTLDGTVFQFDKTSDSFFKQLPLSIDVAEVINQDIELRRVVSRIEFMATDTVHQRLKQFEIHATGQASAFDIRSGKGIVADEKQVFVTTFSKEQIGLKDQIQSFYTFIDDTQPTLDVDLLAIDQADELIRKRSISSIQPLVNQVIRYKGRLFSRSESDDTFQLSIFNNGAWENITEEELPDYD